MKLKLVFCVLLLGIFLTGCANQDATIVPSSDQKVYTDSEQKVNKNNNPPNNMSIAPEKQVENFAAIYKGAIIKTNLGDIEVEFFGDLSPNTVTNFLKLSQSGFYNTTKFHRVITDFMIQGGDPNSKDNDWSNDGMGGPGYKFADEFNDEPLVRGSLAMANSGPNTNGSQFFVVTAAATPWLNGKHTNFGKVVKGMNVVDKIESLPRNENDHPTTDATINSIELIKK